VSLLDLTKKYKKIEYERLKKHNKTLPFDVYSFNAKDKNYVLLAKKDAPTTRLDKAQTDEFFIHKKESGIYNSILSEDLPEYRRSFENKLQDNSASLEEKTNALYSYADLLIENTITNVEDKDKMNETKSFLGLTMDMISVNLSLLDKLQSADDADSYIFRSSINVAIITMAFLQVLAMRNKDITPKEILNAAQGALFRDLGMTHLPRAILHKPDKLTNQEYGFVKLHTFFGYFSLLRSQAIISHAGLNVVLYHHERQDGSGYPYGFKGPEIPFFAKAVAICDVYNAFISDRGYRKAMSPFNAAVKLKKEWQDKFDQDLLKYFIILCGPKDLITSNIDKIK